MVSCVRLVSRCPIKSGLTPVAVLPIRVRNGSRFAGSAPLETTSMTTPVMSDLIIGVVMDVVSHFILNNLQGLSIVRIATAAWDFVILDAAEFVVLDPKVGLE